MTAFSINTEFIRNHPAQVVLTVLGLSGVVLVFLPFTYDVPPMSVFFGLPPLPPFRGILNFDIIYWYVLPFALLPFAISAGYLRWLLTGRLSRREAGVGYALALAVACALVLVILVDWLDWITHPSLRFYRGSVSWPRLAYLLVAFSAGAGFIIQNLRHHAQAVPNALVAMQVVYLPPALPLIELGLDDPQIGWYLTIVPVVAYSAQIVIAAKRPWQALIFFVPLALLWVGLLTLDA